jgi:hypothetical protein
MAKVKNELEPFNRISMITLYLILTALLFSFSVIAFNHFFSLQGTFYALYIVVFIVIAALFGSWLWVVITIPSELPRKFDSIKNKIATGEISSINDFSEELAKFLVNQFSFVGLDIVAAMVKIKNSEPSYYAYKHLAPLQIDNTEEWIELSHNSDRIMYLGKLDVGNHKYHTYLIPIWFGAQWLGYFTVFTDIKLMKLYKNYLELFEEYYVDDQLLHVLHHDSQQNMQHMCSGIDQFAFNLQKNLYRSFQDYLSSLLELLLEETGCKSGYITTMFSDVKTVRNIDLSLFEKLALPVNDKTFQTGIAGLDLGYSKKAFLEQQIAHIVLLDSDIESITKAKSLIDSCLMIKISTQLTNFAKHFKTKGDPLVI